MHHYIITLYMIYESKLRRKRRSKNSIIIKNLILVLSNLINYLCALTGAYLEFSKVNHSR